MTRTAFRIAILRAKMLAKRHICRAVEVLLSAGIKFSDACRMSVVFAGAAS